MSGQFRLASGGRINRGAPVRFTFNGQAYMGFSGDTLASALIANSIHLVGRSFKYHRPRGIYAAGPEDPGALVQLGTGGSEEPNARATQVELYDGLVARSVNAWPSVAFDIGAINGLLSPLLAAGFYYKTFMGSSWLWHKVYEPIIRRAAGWGTAPPGPDPAMYDRMNAHCDVLVIGGGPAGLAAAQAAGRTGARVILIDDNHELGGSLLGRARRVGGHAGADWARTVSAELASLPELRVLTRTTAFGYYDQNYICAVERRPHDVAERPDVARERIWHIRAKRVVLATGAHERPLVFANNDRPGVMLAGAALTYINRFAVLPGRRAVVFTNNDSAYETALALHAAGGHVTAVIDVRANPAGDLVREVRRKGIEILAGHVVTAARGGLRVRGVNVRALAPDGRSLAGPSRALECDLLAVSGGWSPAVHLFCQSQGRLAFNEPKACFVPAASAQAQYCAGGVNGNFSLAGALAEGAAAGAKAATEAGFDGPSAPVAPEIEEPSMEPLRPLWRVPGLPSRSKAFVDLQNDTLADDIELAVREGFESVEHVKRYTLTGFGTDQGKTSNVNAHGILAEMLGQSIGEVGTTTFRPPYTPVTFGAMAGRDRGEFSDPVRVTSIHDWHREAGAVFENVGQWHRPWYYPKPGEDMHAAVARECRAVRTGVGVLDASTLGKIDIQGRDAAEFLERVYTNAWKKLGIGRIRYGLMCREDGMVFDDGTTTRLAEDRFLMTTTTGNAAPVLDHLEEYLQTEWPDLAVHCISVTEQWATAGLAGPKSRAVLAKLAPALRLDNEHFPFMSMLEATVAGLDARIFRISFTGELSYEISVPWTQGFALWQAVMAAGAEFGITPYGTEAMHVLRAEKGFIIIGQETDGTVTPFDLGMEWIVSKQKKDFIGKRSFSRADTRRPDRKQLVGLLTEDPREVLPEGGQLVFAADLPGDLRAGLPTYPVGRQPTPMAGHVTSSYMSPALERSIALALVKGGRARMGETIYIPLAGRLAAARIVDPVFYDKEGARKDG